MTLRVPGKAFTRVPSKYLRRISDKLLIPDKQLQLLDTLGQGKQKQSCTYSQHIAGLCDLSAGEFGVVYRARWTGFHGESPQAVAVKTIKGT